MKSLRKRITITHQHEYSAILRFCAPEDSWVSVVIGPIALEQIIIRIELYYNAMTKTYIDTPPERGDTGTVHRVLIDGDNFSVSDDLKTFIGDGGQLRMII